MKFRNLPAYAALLLTIAFLSACETEDPGPVQERERSFSVTGFDRLEMGSAFVIHVEQGNFFSVKASGDRRNIDDLEVYKDGNTLVIRYDEHRNRHHETTIDITMPELAAVNFSGASHATIYGFSEDDGVRISLSGASVCQADFEADEVDVLLSGASELTMRGAATVLDADVSGASALAAFNFSVDVAHVTASGASDARVGVSDLLHATASGASAIIYRGDPSVDANASGGRTIHQD